MLRSSLLIHPEELTKKWIDRMADAGVTTIALHPVGGHKANLSLEDLVGRFKTEEFRSLLDYAGERGLDIEYEMHAARYLMPEYKLGEHPEWARMNEAGERVHDYNFCISNGDALDYFAERAAELVKKLYRSTNRYYLWLDDAKNSCCFCPECRKLSPSDQQMRVLNRIQRRLKEDNSKAELAYLAYFDTISPPKNEKPEEGIFLEYAPFTRDFHKPVTEYAESEHLGALLNFFGKDSARVLDYWYDNSLYSKWKKPPLAFSVDKEVMKADFEFYRSLGFGEIASFACYLGEDYEELYGEPDISDFGELIK